MHTPMKSYDEELDSTLKGLGWIFLASSVLSLSILGFFCWLAFYVVHHIWP